MKLKALIVICFMGFIGSPSSMAQQWTIEAEPICWSYNGVDSSLNRYVLVSARSNQSRTLFYHDANQNIVDISAGGVLTYGYCDTLCGISEVTIDTFQLNGTSLELALNGSTVQSVDLSGLGVVSSPPILGQTSAPTNLRVFWKDTDDDTTRVYAPFGTEFKPLAYHHEMRAAIDSLRQAVIFQGKAILDTIPIIAGIDQARLDSMHVIGVTSTAAGWKASTAARDTLYPDAFAFQIYNTDSLIIAYSGVLVFPDSVYEKGKNYYQPYDYVKYQTSPDSILEQLVFKAVDTNVIEIRDKYSYLANGADQTSRSIPKFLITYEDFVGTNKDLYYALIPSSTYWDGSTYTNPVDQTTYTQPTAGDRPSLVDGEYFNFNSEDWLSTGNIGEIDTLVAFIKYRITTDVNFGNILGDNSIQNESIMSINSGGYKWAYQFGNPNNVNSVIGLNVDRILAVRVIVGAGKIYVYDQVGETYIADQTPNLTDLQGTTLNEMNINSNQNGARAGIIGRIYGAYLFGGNFSNAEMQSLIENWDTWHMKGF